MDARGQTNPWRLPWNRWNEPGFFQDARDIKYFANTLVTRSHVTLQSPGHVFRQRLIVRQVPLSEFRRLIYPAILFWPTNTLFSYRRFYFRVGPLRHRSACRLWIENICAETGLILILTVCVRVCVCDQRWNVYLRPCFKREIVAVEFLSRMVEVALIWNERIFLDLHPYFAHFYFNIFPDNSNRTFGWTEYVFITLLQSSFT